MTLALELGSIKDPAIQRALQVISQQFPVVAGGGGGGGAPSGPAGGVLGGTYPNPSFAADMATQAELDAHTGLTTTAHGGIVADTDPRLTDARAPSGVIAGDLAGSTWPTLNIAAGAVVNADVNAAAAIARSKLDFGSGLVNADISATAAIAKTKLAALAIVDSDVSATAAIAESKLALATDAAAGTGSRRTLGTTSTSAAAGNRGLPTGGTSTQVLTKNSATDYDVGWTTPAVGAAPTYDGLQAGVVAAGDCALTVNTTAQVTIAAGVMYVLSGGALARTAPGSTVLGSIPVASASNFRLDQIVVSTTGVVSRLQGTEGTTVTLANRTGAAALGTNTLIHDVLVTATGVTAANVRDRRPWARGAYGRITLTSGNLTSAAATPTSLGTSVQMRVECSGAPMWLIFQGQISNNTAAAVVQLSYFMDGAVLNSASQLLVYTAPGVNTQNHFVMVYPFTPAAGSHLFSPAHATTAGTTSIYGSAASPMFFEVREDVRQNQNNGTT